MRRLGWGLAVLWLGAAVSVAMAQGPKYRPGADNGLLKDLFGPSPPKGETTDEPKTSPKSAGKAPAKPKSATRRSQSRELDRLQKVFLRRDAVCTQLSQVGLDTGNERLREEAERLHDLAWKVYMDRVNRVNTEADKREADEAAKPAERSGNTKSARGPLPGRFRAGGLDPRTPERSTSMGEGEQ